jgi:hypothetical protein
MKFWVWKAVESLGTYYILKSYAVLWDQWGRVRLCSHGHIDECMSVYMSMHIWVRSVPEWVHVCHACRCIPSWWSAHLHRGGRVHPRQAHASATLQNKHSFVSLFHWMWLSVHRGPPLRGELRMQKGFLLLTKLPSVEWSQVCDKCPLLS